MQKYFKYFTEIGGLLRLPQPITISQFNFDKRFF